MKRLVPFAIAGFVSIATAAFAQTPPKDEHSGHHPADAAPAAPAAPAGPSGQMQPGHMPSGQMGMGGNMGGMMSMMHGGSMMGGAPGRFVEGRLAFLKTELKVTPAQEPQWSKFADAYRSVVQSSKGQDSHMQTMTGGQASAPERLARYEKHLTARRDAVRTIKAAVDPLYAVLSADQKKLADELLGHVGMM